MANPSTISFIEEVKSRLSLDLPGETAHASMMAYRRDSAQSIRRNYTDARQSAVLMLLYEREQALHTVLMERPANQGVHSGQLSFPGGKNEQNESLEETALRELEEEVGIHAASVQLLGNLTELYIPPSNFLVAPFVGFAGNQIRFNPNAAEVEQLIEIPLEHLLSEPIITYHSIDIPHMNMRIQAPAFEFNGKVIWGATAMILQEFRMLFGYKH